VNDLRGTLDKAANTYDPPDPRFDAAYVPQAPQYAKAGYRSVSAPAPARAPRPSR
jgi:hypothetical protein